MLGHGKYVPAIQCHIARSVTDIFEKFAVPLTASSTGFLDNFKCAYGRKSFLILAPGAHIPELTMVTDDIILN